MPTANANEYGWAPQWWVETATATTADTAGDWYARYMDAGTATTLTTYTVTQPYTVTYGRYTPPPAEQERIDRAAERDRGRMADRTRMIREAERQHEAMQERARTLLEASLTAEQVRQLRADGFFVILDGRYRIRTGRTANIDVMDGARVLRRLCAHPGEAEDLPAHDVMLAQKLMLEACEAEFLRIANVHPAAV